MQPIAVCDKELLEMVLFPVVNEACRVLDEGVVVRSSDLDVASILGMSFPSYRYSLKIYHSQPHITHSCFLSINLTNLSEVIYQSFKALKLPPPCHIELSYFLLFYLLRVMPFFFPMQGWHRFLGRLCWVRLYL